MKIPYVYPPRMSKLRSYNPVTSGHTGQIKKALELILSAQRPMIYTGGGVVLDEAAEELLRVHALLGFPITNTLMGLGAYPGTDEQFVGMLGMHGTYEANMAMHNCDVLIAIGARFDDRVVGDVKQVLPRRAIVHIDIDPSSIAKTVKVHVPIVGSVKKRARRHDQALRRERTQAEPGGPGRVVEADPRVGSDRVPEVRDGPIN